MDEEKVLEYIDDVERNYYDPFVKLNIIDIMAELKYKVLKGVFD